ncbi:uncharacterized protein LOC128732461 [Sabethes cyaneus]|uniref:uncharacterized protein LOC128732461 n=1 Tax=Sabethes cyaneus TaxID=53552 RepID=UPI00237D7E4C|nr:uncharacterized protein LOC128732461 [Sabethes cyaneus]
MIPLRFILLLPCSPQLALVFGSQLEQTVVDVLRRYGSTSQQRHVYLLIESFIQHHQRVGQRRRDFIEWILRPPLSDELAVQFQINVGYPSAHTLLMVDGLRPFQQFIENWTSQRYDLNGYYWIVLLDHILPMELHSMVQLLWDQKILNVAIFTEPVSGRVEMFTYRAYSASVCDSVEMTMINFTGQSLFEDLATNFWGCPLKIGTFDNQPFTEIFQDSNGRQYLRGFEGMLVNLLAEKLNFTVEVVSPPDNAQWGFLWKNGTTTGLLKLIIEETVHFGISSLGYSEERNELLTPGLPYYYSHLVFAVPSGRPYSAFEKLFLPFHWTTWCAVFVTTIATWTTMIIINMQPNRVKDFIYGKGIRSPITNSINILLGGALVRNPTGTFARSMLTFWIIYALIIRTAYQSSLFKFLQEPKNYSAPLTMKQMAEANLYYNMLEYGMYFFSDSPYIMSRARKISHEQGQFTATIERLGRDELDGAVLVLLDHIAYHNKVFPSDQFIQAAKDIICGFPLAIYYPKHTFLRDTIDQQIQQIVPAGLIQSWADTYGDYDFYHQRKGYSVVQALTVRQLIGVFQILTVLETVATLMFLLELLARRAKIVARVVDWLEKD